MDRFSMKHLAFAVAFAFAGTGALAHGTKDTSADADTAVKPGMATSADTAQVPNYAGAEGVRSTPGASDEDHNDEGAARGQAATAPHGKAYGNFSGTSPSTRPDLNDTATPSSTEGTVSPSTTTTR